MRYNGCFVLTCLLFWLFNGNVFAQENGTQLIEKPNSDITVNAPIPLLENLQRHKLLQTHLDLTPKEQAWLMAHPVIKVSNELDYPPFDFVIDKQPHGYSIDLLNLYAKRIGIKIEYVNGYSWSELVELFKKGELDLLHSLTKTPERESFGLFSDPLISYRIFFITQIDNPEIESIDQLAGKTLAVGKDWAEEEFLKENYKDVKLLAFDSMEQKLKAVSSGKAYATLGSDLTGRYILKKQYMTDLKMSGWFRELDNNEKKHFHFLAQKTSPELISILNKAIATLPLSTLEKTYEKWFGKTQDKQSKDKPTLAWFFWAALSLVIVISVILLLFRLLDSSNKNPLAYQFSSPTGKRVVVLFNAFLILFALSLAWWALENIKSEVKEDMEKSLKTILETTSEALTLWSHSQSIMLKGMAKNSQLVNLVEEQLSHYHAKNNLEKMSEIAQLRAIFSIFNDANDYQGFFVIAPDGTNIASMQNSNIGKPNLIQEQRPELLQRAFLGETLLIPPIQSDVDIQGLAKIAGTDLPPTMFFASPIMNGSGKIIAVLAMRLDPHGDFSRINLLGRIGETGETYTFDKDGTLLSESRFLQHMFAAGLIKSGEQSILSFKVRSPDINLDKVGTVSLPLAKQPLTFMAASATKGERGTNVDGYQDYRGVLVIGAWAWNDELGIGMATEIDVTEAMKSYYRARIVIVSIIVVMVLASMAFTLFTMLLGSRTNRALQLARDQLEERVHLRTNELHHSEERFELAMQGANDGLWDWNYITNEIYYSNRWMSMLGYQSGELEGSLETWQNLAHPDDVPRTLALIDACSKGTQDEFKLEFRMRHKDGTWVPILSRASVVRDTQTHEVIRFVGTHIDLTQQKQAENELQKILSDLNEQRYVLDQHAIVAVTDLQGTITHANHKFAEISGYSVDELIGQNHSLLSSKTHDPQFWKGMYREVSSGGVWNQEICNRAKDGHLYWVDTTIAAFKGEDGKPKAYVAIRTDVTARKYYEEELQEAKNQAENANSAKSDFLASMSHEIRTPMNGILGMLGLLTNSDLTDDQARKVEIAQNSAKALLSLINDILDFSKVEAGKLELEELDFDLRSLLEEIANTMIFRTDEKGIQLLLDVTEVNKSMVNGDSSRIRQVIINLIGNAIKFTSQGEIVITATLKEHDADHLKLVCSIRDTGIGIPTDRIPVLFDSFTQVDASTTRQYGGTGLGLTICKKLSELMGGGIKVTSELGKGSTFEFEVLLKPSEQSVNVMPTIDISQLKILIVDDNTTNLEIYRHQLEHWGASVFEASSAKSAIEICEQHIDDLFDIALIDMQMPQMDGAALGKEIRHNHRFDTLKLIMTTSVPEQNCPKNLYSIGFNGFFTKPVSTSDLFDALSVVVSHPSKSQQSNTLITKSYLDTLNRKSEKLTTKELPIWPPQTRILLVDDNQINQLVGQGMLIEMGLTCDFASNGLEAIASLRKAPDDSPYTLVLMDCQMPELDGYGASRNIRQGMSGERYLSLTIIAITANAMKGDREKCLDAGMNDFLTKPLDSISLLNCLKKWLLTTP